MSEIKLSALERRVLKAWDEFPEDFDVIGFDTVSRSSGVEPHKIRAAVRRLARKGVTKFYQVSWSDEGVPNGAGYGLTSEGRSLLKEVSDAS